MSSVAFTKLIPSGSRDIYTDLDKTGVKLPIPTNIESDLLSDDIVTKVKAVSSYNWLSEEEVDTKIPTIQVPGAPPLVAFPKDKDSLQLDADSGHHYIDQNACRMKGRSGMIPGLTACYVYDKQFKVEDYDIITDRNGLLKLFAMVKESEEPVTPPASPLSSDSGSSWASGWSVSSGGGGSPRRRGSPVSPRSGRGGFNFPISQGSPVSPRGGRGDFAFPIARGSPVSPRGGRAGFNVPAAQGSPVSPRGSRGVSLPFPTSPVSPRAGRGDQEISQESFTSDRGGRGSHNPKRASLGSPSTRGSSPWPVRPGASPVRGGRTAPGTGFTSTWDPNFRNQGRDCLNRRPETNRIDVDVISSFNPKTGEYIYPDSTQNLDASGHKTLILTRWEPKNDEIIMSGADFRGYGFAFLTRTRTFVSVEAGRVIERSWIDVTGYHCLVEYEFFGLKVLVRYHADGCEMEKDELVKWFEEAGVKDWGEGAGPVDESTEATKNNHKEPEIQQPVESDEFELLDVFKTLHIAETKVEELPPVSTIPPPPPDISMGGLNIIRTSNIVFPQERLMQVKTRGRSGLDKEKLHTQLFFSQTFHAFVAIHRKGIFTKANVRKMDVTAGLVVWAELNKKSLKKLALLMSDIRREATRIGGKAAVVFTNENGAGSGSSNAIVFHRRREGGTTVRNISNRYDFSSDDDDF